MNLEKHTKQIVFFKCLPTEMLRQKLQYMIPGHFKNT